MGSGHSACNLGKAEGVVFGWGERSGGLKHLRLISQPARNGAERKFEIYDINRLYNEKR